VAKLPEILGESSLMLAKIQPLCVVLLMTVMGCAHAPRAVTPGPAEKHFKSLKQLTFEGTHAEAYFSADGKKLIFQGRQATQGAAKVCDQMYTMNIDGSDRKLISTQGGRNTCGYFIDANKILFSSTKSAGEACPSERDRSKGYVWEIYRSYDIYTANADGSDQKNLTNIDGYDAESTVCNNKITFASARSGNGVHIYTMNVDGTDLKQLTKGVGYFGGPFWSPDCKSKSLTERTSPPKNLIFRRLSPPSRVHIFLQEL
jgi:TolB protein